MTSSQKGQVFSLLKMWSRSVKYKNLLKSESELRQAEKGMFLQIEQRTLSFHNLCAQFVINPLVGLVQVLCGRTIFGPSSGNGEDRPRSVVPSDEADGVLECEGRGGNNIAASIADS